MKAVRASARAAFSLPPAVPPSGMARPLAKTREWRNVDLRTFREEIIPCDRPAVLKGLVADWPVVAAKTPRALREYLKAYDTGRPVQTALGPPEIEGRLFYNDDLSGFNFERVSETFDAALNRIIAHLDDEAPPAIYAGAVSTHEAFPGFARDNAMPLLGASVVSRIWASGPVTAPTHYDMSDNIACVVAGRRRFTFFPPEQLANLYVGPLDFTPAGQPTSMVQVAAPDLARFPRYARALEAAEEAELEPGDAVFIPSLWWHNVESLSAFNILVNYWWYDTPPGAASPFSALVHALLAMEAMPARSRTHWRRLFDHYVFRADGDPAVHIPPARRGMLGAITPALAAHIKAMLRRTLDR